MALERGATKGVGERPPEPRALLLLAGLIALGLGCSEAEEVPEPADRAVNADAAVPDAAGPGTGEDGGSPQDATVSGDAGQPVARNGQVRFVHLAPSRGPLALQIDGTSALGATATVAFGASSPWLVVPAGLRDFAFAPVTGPEISAEILELTVEDERSYTLVVWGEADQASLPAFSVSESFHEPINAGLIRTNVVHVATGLSVVDVFAFRITPDPGLPRLATGVEQGTFSTVNVPVDIILDFDVAIILDEDQDQTADATITLPNMYLTSGAEFFNFYLVTRDGETEIYAHSASESGLLVGPFGSN